MATQSTAEILNKNNLSKAKEILNNLSKNLNTVIQNISADLAIGSTISTNTNNSITQWFSYLTSVSNQTIGYFYYDSGTGIITIQLAFSGKYEGSIYVTNLCTINLNNVNTIMTNIQTNYNLSIGYDMMTINADVETLKQMIEQICSCISKIETILGKYNATCDTGTCDINTNCAQKNAEIYFSYNNVSYPNDTGYAVVTDFYFSGSDYYGSDPSQIIIIASGSSTNSSNSFTARIVDIGLNGSGTGGSSNIVATITGNYQALPNPMGYLTNVFNNISNTATLWELQIKPNQPGDAVILYSMYIRI